MMKLAGKQTGSFRAYRGKADDKTTKYDLVLTKFSRFDKRLKRELGFRKLCSSVGPREQLYGRATQRKFLWISTTEAESKLWGRAGSPTRLMLTMGQILDDNFRVEVKSLSEINDILASIEEFGQRHKLPVEIVFHLQLACDELLTNAVSYGFPDGHPPQICLLISRKNNTIEAEIVDNGIPFNPLAQSEPDLTSSLDERKIGGLGIHFIRTVIGDLKYHRSQGRNHIEMVLPIPSDSR